ncbi:MAG: menaquinone biosynthesis decarboxylase [Campylobacter sp.]|nr:menaquinone biosynthesis decarboxylase [Campylobacter sp.]
MKTWIEILRKNGLLKEINEELDIDLQIAHTSYIEVKKSDSKALFFTNVVDKDGNKYPPVLTNTFGSYEATKLILGAEPDEIAARIQELLKPKKAKNLSEKIDFLGKLFSLRNALIKRKKERGECQDVAYYDAAVNLFNLPVLKTWPLDGGHFITMGQVYTQSLDGELQNLGMYRLQVYGKNQLGMHWQIHKDGANFFDEYKKAGKKMPVSVAIGGDPLYIWCGQAPLPKGIFELLLYGFIRNKPAVLVKSLTNDIYIPHDADFVIEGFVDPNLSKLEGPFGDHTGFYTPVEPFALMQVNAITHKKEPVFHATVVGKPPLEDKYMGWATGRIFMPLLKTTVPELVDYNMPENGVFHNLILAKINSLYPAHAQQAMHAFWGVGQMSFVKHAIFVGLDAPDLDDYDAITEFILNRFGTKGILISQGVCDQLDHASPNSCFGGKLGLDVTSDFSSDMPKILNDDSLLEKFKEIYPNVIELRQFKTATKSPICVVKIDKKSKISKNFEELKRLEKYFKILVFVGLESRLENPYMLIWRVVNNIDAMRDVYIRDERVYIDATIKDESDGYTRQWPKQTDCDRAVVQDLIKRNIVKNDPELFEKYEIFG